MELIKFQVRLALVMITINAVVGMISHSKTQKQIDKLNERISVFEHQGVIP